MKNQNLKKLYRQYLIPTILAMLLFSSYTMVDGIFVGKGIGKLGLSSVNVAMPYIAFIFSIAMLIAIGSSNIITFYMGKDDMGKAHRYFSRAIFLAIFLGITISIFSIINIDRLSSILGARDDIKDMVHDYLKIIIGFSTFFIVSYMFEIMVKADGSPKLAVVFNLISAFTNIVLDYIFIFKFSWGIKGAAIATGISQVLPAIGYMWHFLGKNSKLKFKKFKLHLKSVSEIIKFGFSASLSELSTGFTIMVFNIVIGKYYGVFGLSAFSIISYILNLFVNGMLAINQASQPLISYYLGAENLSNIKELKKLILKSVAIISIFVFVLIEIFPKQIVMIFVSDVDNEFLNFSIKTIRIFSLSFLILGYNIAFGGFSTALKNPKYELFISLSRGYILASFLVFFLPMIFGKNIIWLSLLISDAITLIFSYFMSIRLKNKYEFDYINS